MDKQSLLQLFKTVVGLTDFKEDKKTKGWMPKLGPNDYRSVIRHGWLKNERAMIKVSPYENLAQIAGDFKRYQKAQKPGMVKVPEILRSGKIKGGEFLIQQSALVGERIQPNYPLSTTEQKEEVAKLYWSTINNFPKYDFGEWAVSDYFLARLDKWFGLGRENGAVKNGFITQDEKDQAMELIFSNMRLLRVEAFFDHFANSDIVKTNGQYLIWEAKIVPKPEAAGIALWLWGATLYAYNLPVQKWLAELEGWTKTFIKYAPAAKQKDLRLKIKINFLERLLGSLLVDLPFKRSPFQDSSANEIKQAKHLLREVLRSQLG